MPSVLTLTMRQTAPVTTGSEGNGRLRTVSHDVYDLEDLPLSSFTGIILTAGCDQRFLAGCRSRLDSWVRAGGRLLVNGHPMLRFVTGLPELRRLDFHGIDDLRLTAVGQHPIWEGIDREDLLLRTGVPGRHSHSDLLEIGVAGFYAHSYLARIPAEAVTITGIGDGRLPVDVSYRLGGGEVIVHAGNDLTSFTDPRSGEAILADRVLTHLEGR